MTKEDVRFYLDLKGALIHKFLNPDAFDFQFSTGSIRYEPTIFRWVKSTFQTLQNKYGISYDDYLKIEERPVLEKLVKNLGHDPRLRFLNNPESDIEDFELSGQFHQQIEQEGAAEGAEQQTYAGTEGGSIPMPAIPRIPIMPRRTPSISRTPVVSTGTQSRTPVVSTGTQYRMSASTRPQMPPLPQTPHPAADRTIPKLQEGGFGKKGFNFPKTPRDFSNAAKNAWTSLGTNFKKLTGKYFNPATLATGAATGIGAAVGGAVIGGPLGAVAGGGGGFALAKSIGSGGGGFFARLGNRAINFGTDFSNYFSRRQLMNLPKKSAIYFLLFLLFMVGMLIFLTGAGPISPPVGEGDISMCLFRRSLVSPTDAAYKSPILINYFKEAATVSGVPAVVLAAIARVESPSASNLTDADLPNYQTTGCPLSPTGARGIMQIQPPGTPGHPAGGYALGATYLGIPPASIDLCNLKHNIFVGAGVINSKMGGAFDTTKLTDKAYIDTLATRYYGCLLFPSCTDGPASYGDDMYTSIINCKATGPVLAEASCPIPDSVISCASYGPLAAWASGFTGICRVDTRGFGGHCNDNYIAALPGICEPRESGGNLRRDAKAIDVVKTGGARAGDPVFLPTISGKSLNWTYKGVRAAGTVGHIRLFESEPTTEGVWSIQFTHVNSDNPILITGQKLLSGQMGATLFDQGSNTHLHISIGINIGDTTADLKTFSSGWKFPDRELKMCI